MMKKHEILLGLTTTPNSDWRGKVEEMKKFGIKRIALFPTFLNINQRRKLYKLLEQIEGLQIPHVHLREEDIEAWEMQWFETRGAETFNIHARRSENEALVKYHEKIFIENHPFKILPEHNLESHGGICLDFQHWKFALPMVAQKTKFFAEKYKIGCCHMSALPKWKNLPKRLFKRVDNSGHYMISLDEMDYLLEYKKYFPQYLSIELENSFAEQLQVKAYLEKLLEI